MIERPTGMAIAPVEFSPNREELRSMIIILGEDAKRIPFRDVESDRRTIEWQNTLQGRADGTQQFTLTQFSNDRVVDFEKNADALLRQLCGTRIARNSARSPGFFLSSVSRSHQINAYYGDKGILHVNVSVNPEPRANSKLYHQSWPSGVVSNTAFMSFALPRQGLGKTFPATAIKQQDLSETS
jgi:hypothetical protein